MTVDTIKLRRNQTSSRRSPNWKAIWILRFAKSIPYRIAHVLQARKDRKLLLGMSDSMLKDIGISRCDVYRITKHTDFE